MTNTATPTVEASTIEWSTTRDDRRTRLDCTICDAVAAELCEPDRPTFCHVGRTWSIGMTSPGAIMQRRTNGGDLVALTDQCAPTIESIHGIAGISYRGACLGANCGWVGPEHACDENPAVEDAHDHTHPGWRDLPIVTPAPFDAKDKQRDAWRVEINRIYRGLDHAEHLTLPGGVIRTARRQHGTRSHWSHPVGGYDICGSVTAVTLSAPRLIAAADTLF